MIRSALVIISPCLCLQLNALVKIYSGIPFIPDSVRSREENPGQFRPFLTNQLRKITITVMKGFIPMVKQ